ncbi:hypothetical protein EYZ11_009700 [Aspergillus tanneri]|uniref:Alpha/beta hydrolase fold-3 domain-containing protein n=1 Tax=Aspergillus tanneri TaxID=1220188 RepID=A0A4S3J9C9_9EURO|nr:hypothetical protein EYZ11_009700 [Aspergillus tanneri]
MVPELLYWCGPDNPTSHSFGLAHDTCTFAVLETCASAHIVTAEFDVKRDEGIYYGELLREAGNQVTMKTYAGVRHAFPHITIHVGD